MKSKKERKLHQVSFSNKASLVTWGGISNMQKILPLWPYVSEYPYSQHQRRASSVECQLLGELQLSELWNPANFKSK